MPYNVRPHDMARYLRDDLPSVLSASVARSDPTDGNNCADGLCPNGPDAAYGYTWTLTLACD